MPIYEYVCPTCEAKFEKLRPFSQADEEATCPECNEKKSKRVLSTFACCTTDSFGGTSSIGGGACSSCASGNCSTCSS